MPAPSAEQSGLVYKIVTRVEWEAACRDERFDGSADDRRDGYVHLSAAHQLAGTAARYFRGQHDLVLAAFKTEDLAPLLRWEPARGGELFPHVYGPLATGAALWVKPLPLGPDGVALLPEDL